MGSFPSSILDPSQALTSIFNFSATIAWDTTMPTNPHDAFVGSLENSFNFATSWMNR